MKIGVNYSPLLAELIREESLQIEVLKCPAWIDVIEAAQRISAETYIHFPLKAGTGTRSILNMETNQPADFVWMQSLLDRTLTPYINIHLSPDTTDHPNIPVDSEDSAHIDQITECLIGDVQSTTDFFGSERVVLENDHDNGNSHLLPAYLPEVIRHVVVETGCGFLFDLSHARLAARRLGMKPYDYISALPISHIKEIHVTGIQPIDSVWVERLRKRGIEEKMIQRFAGRLMDHLPMMEEDWIHLEWAVSQIRTGDWGQPWVLTLEYGGVGPLWEAVTDKGVLLDQVPRLMEYCTNLSSPSVR